MHGFIPHPYTYFRYIHQLWTLYVATQLMIMHVITCALRDQTSQTLFDEGVFDFSYVFAWLHYTYVYARPGICSVLHVRLLTTYMYANYSKPYGNHGFLLLNQQKMTFCMYKWYTVYSYMSSWHLDRLELSEISQKFDQDFSVYPELEIQYP